MTNISTSSTAVRQTKPVSVRLICRCGTPVGIETSFICSCGAHVAQLKDGTWFSASATDNWGEIESGSMDRLLAEAQNTNWRTALMQVAPELSNNATNPNRAAFEDVLPLAPGSHILEVGAGLGAIACQMARRHDVVALERIANRAKFTAIRKAQQGLDNVTVVCGDLNVVKFAPAQFDAVIVNGVLESVAIYDESASPDEIQVRVLQKLRTLLRPGGYIYVAARNRVGWAAFRGVPDRSGLRYTSLLPRFLASYVCSRSKTCRSQSNRGYRAYTYGYRGYESLFARAGLRIASAWIAPLGYDLPSALVPLNEEAIDTYVGQNSLCVPVNRVTALRNSIRMHAASKSFWQRFGDDYIFLLEAASA